MTLNEAIAQAANYPIVNHRAARFEINGRTYRISEIRATPYPIEGNPNNYEVVVFLTTVDRPIETAMRLVQDLGL